MDEVPPAEEGYRIIHDTLARYSQKRRDGHKF